MSSKSITSQIIKMKLILGLIIMQFFTSLNSQDVNPCGDISVGIFPHPENCGYFIICIFFIPIVQECPPNSIFVPNFNSTHPNGECKPGESTKVQLLCSQHVVILVLIVARVKF